MAGRCLWYLRTHNDHFFISCISRTHQYTDFWDSSFICCPHCSKAVELGPSKRFKIVVFERKDDVKQN